MSMHIPVIAICGIATDEPSWDGMPVDRIVIPRGPSIAAMADAILPDLPDRFTLCGHSMGGYVALELMQRVADRVAGLALISTSARADTPEQREGRALLIEQAQHDFAGVVEKLALAILSASSRTQPGLLDETRAMLMRCGGPLFAQQQAATSKRPDRVSSLGSIAVPTLIVSGQEDRIVAPERSEELADAIENANLVRISRCGHWPQREAPDVTREALEHWILAVDR